MFKNLVKYSRLKNYIYKFIVLLISIHPILLSANDNTYTPSQVDNIYLQWTSDKVTPIILVKPTGYSGTYTPSQVDNIYLQWTSDKVKPVILVKPTKIK